MVFFKLAALSKYDNFAKIVCKGCEIIKNKIPVPVSCSNRRLFGLQRTFCAEKNQDST